MSRKFALALCAMLLIAAFGIGPALLADRGESPVNAANIIAQPTRLAAPTVTSAADTQPQQISWFNFSTASAQNWQLAPDTADPLRFTVKARDNSLAGGKKILAFFYKKSSAFDIGLNTILQVFHDQRINADFTALNMDGKTAAGSAALQYAQQQKFDLIFSMGSDATAFLYANFRNGPIPVVSVVAKDPVLLGQMKDYTSGSNTNIAYTSVNVPTNVQLTFLRQLTPQLKNIGVLYEKNNQSAIQTQVEPLRRALQNSGVNMADITVDVNDQAQQELETKIPVYLRQFEQSDPGLKNSILWITGSTTVFDQIETITRVSANAAVISAFPELVRAGDSSAVVGIGVSFATNSHLAAIYGIDILQGRARAGDLKVGVVTPPDIAINFKKAREIGLTIPFSFFESATTVFDYAGQPVRQVGAAIKGVAGN